MQPATLTTIRPDLATGVLGFNASVQKFMGLSLLPPIGVQLRNGSFGKITYAEMTEAPLSIKRAPGSEYYRTETNVTTDTYDCEEYGQEEAIDDGNSLVVGQYFDAEMTAARKAAYNLLYQQEVRIKTLIQTTGTFSSTYQSACYDEWDQASTATPIKDVLAAKMKLYSNSGADESMGGKLVLGMSHKVYTALVGTNDVKGALGFNGPGLPPSYWQTESVARALGVDQVVYSVAQSSGTDIWDDEYAYLFLTSDSPDMSIPRLGNVFRWDADCADNALVETYRDEKVRSNIVRVRQFVDEKVVNVACGILITNAYTS